MTSVPRGGQVRQRVGHRVRRGAYLLPSLFTMGNMILGFYAVIVGYRDHDFTKAALLIFAAAILDSLDGRMARLVGTESDFGKEYDSLADVVTFGVAPALLTYLWGLQDFHRDSWMISVFYMVCCATRLARFNVQTKVVDARWFVGLPTPAAAGTICSLLFFSPGGDLRVWMQVLVASSLLIVGALMVSTFRYTSFKKVDLRKRWSFRALVPIVAIVLVVYFLREAAFLTLAVLYTLSGPVGALVSRMRRGGSAPTPPTPEPVP
ncbi:MAG TPA: CDP-diacylglycerol--serine O-phosphatidyltransferase [Thermoanaerobaculia bacterium]|nr:CDP-diacylglycerol--serine O-phosphatidyltransferase [Thermoanaerobaculia bacterium]